MASDTVEVDGQEYIFPPQEVVKPQKTEQNQEDREDNLLYDAQNGGLQ